ncbi:fumarylacetoacetate hydrolase family protein [Paenibacillus thalictri]|uniref:Fumarylacetoacetate hydrolase family protein n=1 Tax=Paenibacillus thalictri TaxID=2527873 RepID=A0A4Q9DJI7_9BACL|nr:fumarylacetoacetate hydrolase family protein [Paenibacillus thalictri]TBL70757.1 fumarylacetoacetate hydrolase family protein [Paenibacillus thalictri]
MKLTTIQIGGSELAAVAVGTGLIPLDTVNRLTGSNWAVELLELLKRDQLAGLQAWFDGGGKEQLAGVEAIPYAEAVIAPLYRNPRKIWGIGMNYVEKAVELASTPPDMEPICFLKPDTSLIGPGDAIVLPAISERVTAEAEIGIIIGKTCKEISEAEAPLYVAGLTPTLDMTAQDIHAKNPRFLGRSKCFDTFFSFGPYLVTLDEVGPLDALVVETGLNGEVTHRNTVANMIYRPWYIVSYFSQMMTLLPGDIIMTGTPGSALLRDGDVAECRISGFDTLLNPVKQ